jgi:hypothetical protein
MKKKIIYTSLLAVGIISVSCNKLLDKVDINGVSPEVVWGSEGTATLYLNNLYNLIMPIWPSSAGGTSIPSSIHNTSDDQNNGDARILQGTLTAETITDFYATGNPNNVWGYIRKCNILLTQIDQGTVPQEAKDKIKAQAYFLRAWLYFNLVKLYGGVPYLNHPQDWISENVLVPRDKTSACIDSICNDLDKGAILPAKWPDADFGRITRGAALALKARVLLYWASPQFNPANDAARWERAYTANKAAYDTLTKDGYVLNTSFANFNDKAASNREPIIVRVYNGATDPANSSTNYENVTRPYSESAGSGGGQNQPTWNLVTAFPMKNGLQPFNPDGTVNTASGYDSVYYWKGRDPRFDATIVYNGAVWALSGKSGRKQWNYKGITDDKTRASATGFYTKKNIQASVLAANTAQSNTNWVEMRMAEVMLNLAECANKTNRQAEALDMLKKIRQRAGITAGAGSLYGLPAAASVTAFDDIIFNERRIELAFEGKRYDDLRRTRRFHLLNGSTRLQLEINPKAPFTIATLEAKDVNGVFFRDKLNIEDTATAGGTIVPDYKKYFTATVKLINVTGELPITYPLNYYFYAIPTTNISKNPNMLQNEGWPTGTFKPTE